MRRSGGQTEATSRASGDDGPTQLAERGGAEGDAPDAPVGPDAPAGPAAGVTVEEGGAATLVVSSGAPVTVPSVVAENEEPACAEIEATVLTASVQQVPSDLPGDGRVVEQDPRPGTEVDRGSTVSTRVGGSVGRWRAAPARPPPPRDDRHRAAGRGRASGLTTKVVVPIVLPVVVAILIASTAPKPAGCP